VRPDFANYKIPQFLDDGFHPIDVYVNDMDGGIGIAASLATLIKVVGVAFELTERIQNAPRELGKVSAQLQSVQVQLHLLDELQKQSPSTSIRTQLPQETQLTLTKAIQTARVTIYAINDACIRRTSSKGVKARLHWAFLGRSTVTHLLDELRRTESSLSLVLNLLTLYVSGPIHELSLLTWISHRLNQPIFPISDNSDSMVQVMEEVASMRRALELHIAQQTHRMWKKEKANPHYSRDSCYGLDYVARQTMSRSLPDSLLFYLLGLQGTLSSSWNDKQSIYLLSLRSRLPLQKLFVFDLAIRIHGANWPSFSILREGGMALKNVVPEDSAIMRACSLGDTMGITKLFENNQAKPTDVTANNDTPLLFAIESGELKAVELLINWGADVNWPFGKYQTSPLAWALRHRQLEIARLLLSHGASLDHLTAYGWSALFYLWSDPQSPHESSVEYLKLLGARPDFDLLHKGLHDVKGLGVLHRAVAFGTTEEVVTLIQLGADPFDVCDELGWTLLHRAVYYGKFETFCALLPYYQHVDIDALDKRGWTLLHLAARRGHQDICRQLLSMGADWKRKSMKCFSHIHESLRGGCWTPAELAKAYSMERYEMFMVTVEKVLGPEVFSEDEVRVEELWFDAVEHNYIN
jgi:ankyrin repeat protein